MSYERAVEARAQNVSDRRDNLALPAGNDSSYKAARLEIERKLRLN